MTRSSDRGVVKYEESRLGEFRGRTRRVLTAASYEKRFVVSLSRVVDALNPDVVELLVFSDYVIPRAGKQRQPDEEAVREYQENLREARRLLRDRGVRVVEHEMALENMGALVRIVRALNGNGLAIDVSSFPRAYILVAMRHLAMYPECIVYTKGARHRESRVAYSAGVLEVVTLPGFEGRVGHHPTLLILSVGYEGPRAIRTFRAYDPALTVAILGDPGEHHPNAEAIRDTARKRNGSLLATERVIHEVLPAYDPWEFAKACARIIDDGAAKVRCLYGTDECDVIAAALGTKLQTLGLYSAWTMRRQTQMAYPIPTVRRIGTEGAGESSCFRVSEEA